MTTTATRTVHYRLVRDDGRVGSVRSMTVPAFTGEGDFGRTDAAFIAARWGLTWIDVLIVTAP